MKKEHPRLPPELEPSTRIKTRQITPESSPLASRTETPTPGLKPFIRGESLDILETARAELAQAESKYMEWRLHRFPNPVDGEAELIAEIKLRRDLVRALELLADASIGLCALFTASPAQTTTTTKGTP